MSSRSRSSFGGAGFDPAIAEEFPVDGGDALHVAPPAAVDRHPSARLGDKLRRQADLLGAPIGERRGDVAGGVSLDLGAPASGAAAAAAADEDAAAEDVSRGRQRTGKLQATAFQTGPSWRCFHIDSLIDVNTRSQGIRGLKHGLFLHGRERRPGQEGAKQLLISFARPAGGSGKDGDSGLIAVAVLGYRGEVLEIQEWLMSCRVLLRGVEDCMMNAVTSFARAHGFKTMRGFYRPTAKNGMVADFYARYGFARGAGAPDGGVEWLLDTARYAERPVYFASRETELAR